MNETVRTLIAVKSTERRDALYALLESLKRFDVIDLADSDDVAGELLEAHCPAVVLADFQLFSVVPDHCNAEVIVLVVDQAEQAHARTEGAEHVFIEGTPVSQLVATIERLLEAAKTETSSRDSVCSDRIGKGE